MTEERLQKILARAGVASRRAAEQLITAGRVAVNGVVVTELGSKADPESQAVTVDGRPLPGPESLEYWMAHKPVGVVSTAHDPQGRPRVVDLLPPGVGGRLYPVGRLDLDSEGLVLLTNDGQLAFRLMHPRFQVPKHYRVWVAGFPTGDSLERLRTGVPIEGRPTSPAKVTLKGGTSLRSKLSFVIYEGRKREIRLMCAAVGHPVQRLVRLALGPLKLGELPPGAVRRLTPAEVTELKQAAGLISGCKPRGHGVKKSRVPTRPAGEGGAADQGRRRGGAPGRRQGRKSTGR